MISCRSSEFPCSKLQFGQTPLHYAAAFGQVPCIRQLLRSGANPALREVSGRTPADLAAAGGYLDAAALLQQHASGGSSAFGARTAYAAGQPFPARPMSAGAAPPYGLAGSAPHLMGLGAGHAAHASGFATVPPSATIGMPGTSMGTGMGMGMGMPGAAASGGPGPMASSAWAWKLLAPAVPGEAAPLSGGFAPAPYAVGSGAGPGWPAGPPGPGGFADTGIAHQYASAFGGSGYPYPGSAQHSPQAARGSSGGSGSGTRRPSSAAASGAASALPAPAVLVADARSRLRDWLTSLSMLYVLPSLVASGYDDIDFIASVGLSDADIDNLGVTAPGHRRKLLHLYGIDKYASVPGRTTGSGKSGEGDGEGRAVSPVSAPEAEGEEEEGEGEGEGEEEEGAEGEGEEEGDAEEAEGDE